MSYALNIRKEPDHLCIEAIGNRTPDSLVAVANACAAACKEHGYARFLLDVQRMTGELSTLDSYEVAAKQLPPLARGLGLRAAILDAEENIHRLQFFENVSVNMGINLRVFSNSNSALTWLCGAASSSAQ